MRITADSIANEIRMKRTQFKGAFIICEGSTDARFLNRFVDGCNAKIIVAHEKDVAICVIEILDRAKTRGVIAIVDADFDRISGTVPSSTNIVCTGGHDLDLMLFCSSALDKVIGEYASPEKLLAFESAMRKTVRNAVIEGAVEVGLLRYISIRHGLRLKFEGLKFNDFVDRDSLRVDQNKLVDAVRNLSNRHDLKREDLIQKCEVERHKNHDRFDVCCGHDLSELLAYGLRRPFGSCDTDVANGSGLEAQLRLSYEDKWFTTEAVFIGIRNWEAANTPYVILKQ